MPGVPYKVLPNDFRRTHPAISTEFFSSILQGTFLEMSAGFFHEITLALFAEISTKKPSGLFSAILSGKQNYS